jgi:hypothetical protein
LRFVKGHRCARAALCPDPQGYRIAFTKQQYESAPVCVPSSPPGAPSASNSAGGSAPPTGDEWSKRRGPGYSVVDATLLPVNAHLAIERDAAHAAATPLAPPLDAYTEAFINEALNERAKLYADSSQPVQPPTRAYAEPFHNPARQFMTTPAADSSCAAAVASEPARDEIESRRPWDDATFLTGAASSSALASGPDTNAAGTTGGPSSAAGAASAGGVAPSETSLTSGAAARVYIDERMRDQPATSPTSLATTGLSMYSHPPPQTSASPAAQQRSSAHSSRSPASGAGGAPARSGAVVGVWAGAGTRGEAGGDGTERSANGSYTASHPLGPLHALRKSLDVALVDCSRARDDVVSATQETMEV